MSLERSAAVASRRLAPVLLGLVLAGLAGASPVASVELTSPGDITVGADRNLWFPETGTNRIGRITTAGTIQEFVVPGAAALGRVIAAGPDGRLWVLGSGLDGLVHVWAVSTAGVADAVASLGESPALGVGFLPAGIAAGPDGNVWVAKLSAIARVSPAGQVVEFPVPSDRIPTSITAGPDGHLWFVSSVGTFVARRQAVSRVATNGTIEDVLNEEARQGISTPSSIIAGPDGGLWFADGGYSEIVRVALDPPAATAFPYTGATAIAAGPDGNIWITAFGRRIIARLTPSGTLTEFELTTPLSNPSGIVAGPDGNLWFTEPEHGAIGRITPDGVVTEFGSRLTVRIPRRSPRSPRTIGSR
jgi:virginiamycin B lyase